MRWTVFSLSLCCVFSCAQGKLASTIGLSGVEDSTGGDGTGGDGDDPSADPAAPTLTSIAVSPLSYSTGYKGTQTFSAMGTYSDGTTRDVTATAVWNVTNPSAATLVGSTLTGSGAGGATALTATLGGVVGQASFTAVGLSSITLSPTAVHLLPGGAASFTAIATFSNSTTADVSATADWSFDQASLGFVLGGNAVAAQGAGGTTQIRASMDGVSGTAEFRVANVTALALNVTAADLGVQGPLQLTANATYSTGATIDVTNDAVWSSDTPNVATVSNVDGSKGQVTRGSLVGTALVRADFSGAFAQSTLRAPHARHAIATTTAASGNLYTYGMDVTTGHQRFVGQTYVGAATAIATHPRVNMAYVAVSNFLYAYSLTDRSDFTYNSGATTCSGGVAALASAKAVYVVCPGSNTVRAHALLPSGAIDTTVTLPAVTTGSNPRSIVLDVSGAFAYVANTTGGSISSFSVAANGGLTALATTANSGGPVALAVSPYGNVLYAANSTTHDVSAFTISSTGALTRIMNGASSTFALSSPASSHGPVSLAVDPSNRFLYVANGTSVTLSLFLIDSAGVLSLISATPAALTGLDSLTLVRVDPSGRYLYAHGLNDTWQMRPSYAGGAMSLLDVRKVRTRSNGLSFFSSTSLASTQFDLEAFYGVANDGSLSSCYVNATSGLLSCGTMSPSTINDTTPDPYYPTDVEDFVVDPFYRASSTNPVRPLWIGDNGDLQGDSNTKIWDLVDDQGYFLRNENATVSSHSLATSRMALDPRGYFLYVANYSYTGAGQISGLAQDDPGLMYTNDILVGGGTTVAGCPVNQTAIQMEHDPSARYLILLCTGITNNLRSYSVSQQTGELTLASSVSISVASDARFRIDPAGRYLYLLKNNAPTAVDYVITYPLSTTGVLGASQNNVLGVNFDPIDLAVHPSGDYLYVMNATTLRTYPLGEDTGTTGSEQASQLFIVSGGATALHMHPSGTFLWIARSNGNISTHAITSFVPSVGTLNNTASSAFKWRPTYLTR
jgi:6-phosphogluconolactonase (cycloisomerase 2 family)